MAIDRQWLGDSWTTQLLKMQPYKITFSSLAATEPVTYGSFVPITAFVNPASVNSPYIPITLQILIFLSSSPPPTLSFPAFTPVTHQPSDPLTYSSLSIITFHRLSLQHLAVCPGICNLNTPLGSITIISPTRILHPFPPLPLSVLSPAPQLIAICRVLHIIVSSQQLNMVVMCV